MYENFIHNFHFHEVLLVIGYFAGLSGSLGLKEGYLWVMRCTEKGTHYPYEKRENNVKT